MAESSQTKSQNKRLLLIFVLLAACFLVSLLRWPGREGKSSNPVSSKADKTGPDSHSAGPGVRPRPTPRRDAELSAEERVVRRLGSFSKNRRELVNRFAVKLGVQVPSEVEQFFAAAEAGNWTEVERLFKALKARRMEPRQSRIPGLESYWPALLETYGAHEAAHNWPAQALLDYGDGILNSLKPGMVYIGGTDPGRFIPTFLNETSGSDPHIVLTQNAFADGSYLEYLRFLYGDRLSIPTPEDSQRTFNDYLADLQKRYQHDQQFPNEPRQMRGENYTNDNGRIQVGGSVAVMGINEMLLRAFLTNNPTLSFALEESTSLPSTYEGALPLGPILALQSRPADQPLTRADAAAALDYWREASSRLLAAQDLRGENDTTSAYAHLVTAQGNFFSSQNLASEAEEAYRLARQLAPDYLDSTLQYAGFLSQHSRASEALRLLDAFRQSHPADATAIDQFRAGISANH